MYFILVSLQFKCFFDVNFDGLHAEIVGDFERRVSNSILVTLDASLSNNPNEPKNRQGNINYVWECDVQEDVENCKEYVTSGNVFTLTILNYTNDSILGPYKLYQNEDKNNSLIFSKFRIYKLFTFDVDKRYSLIFICEYCLIH